MHKSLFPPLTVPENSRSIYLENYKSITHGTGRLFLFAGDQKIEHLNSDFYGNNIPDHCNNPELLFNIASEASSKKYIGCFATQLGMIARYGHKHRAINYIVKLNSKTNLYSGEPHSEKLNSIEQVISLRDNHKLNMRGVGYTIYLGSEHEKAMLREASQVIYHAHQAGLLAMLWVYPRGNSVTEENHPNIIAGAAGVATALGADFVKINTPAGESPAERAQNLKQAVHAAGNTGVMCAGGKKQNPEEFLKEIHAQMALAGTNGVAIGRNIYQQDSVADSIALCEKIGKLIYNL